MSELRSRPAWRALENHHDELRDLHLRDLLAKRIAGEVMSEAEPELAHDSSTTALIRRYGRSRNGRES
jgi:hypothetical protein